MAEQAYTSQTTAMGTGMTYAGDKDKVRRVLERHQRLKEEKEPWLNTYRLVGEYVMSRKQNFNQELQQGQILTGQIFDGTAPRANQLMAASLLGALYPNGPRSFRIDPPDDMTLEESGNEEVKQWYDYCTKRQGAVMDNYRAGLLTSLMECFTDQGAFGTAGIGIFEDYDDDAKPVTYVAYDVKCMCISEGINGFVDTVYIEREMTVKQLIQEYGYKKVSTQSQEKYEKDPECKVKVLHAIEPRIDGVPNSFGSDNMPIASIHIEIDNRHQLRESGFWEMPILVTRFYKGQVGEKYGRSPAMETMPDILEINLFREATIVATEKMLNPPLVVNDPDVLSGGRVRTSAGAQNVRKMGGRTPEANSRPAVEPIITIQEIQSTYERIKELVRVIEAAFFIDRLTDLQTDRNRITATEATMLNDLRGQSLTLVYARQIAELLTPLIERTFNILFNRDFFGVQPGSDEHLQALAMGASIRVIPEIIWNRIQSGRDAYKVTYIAPAMRIMQAEELQGIENTLMTVMQVAQAVPSILDNFDFDEIARLVRQLAGAPATIIKSMEVVEKFRKQQIEQQQAQQQMMAENMQSETARNMGQAIGSITGKAGARAA